MVTASLVEIYIDGDWIEFPDGLKRAAAGDVFRLIDREEGSLIPMGFMMTGDVGETLANGAPYIVALEQGRLMTDSEGDICGGVRVNAFETIEGALAEALELVKA